MEFYEWFMSFSQITAPVLLLIPQLVTSLKFAIPPKELEDYYKLLFFYYIIIIIVGAHRVFFLNGAGFFLDLKHFSWTNLAQGILFVLVVFLVFLAVAYVARWSLQEQITRHQGWDREFTKDEDILEAPKRTRERKGTPAKKSPAKRTGKNKGKN